MRQKSIRKEQLILLRDEFKNIAAVEYFKSSHKRYK